MTYRLITAPASEPITLAEAKAHLRVTSSAEDTKIAAFISAAVGFVDAEGYLGRAMVTQTWAKWVSNNPGWVRIGLGPFIELTAVDYYDTDGALQSSTLSNYETRLDGDDVLVRPKDGFAWPGAQSRADAIRLTFTAGYGDAGDVPEDIKQALLVLVGHFYENRSATSDTAMAEVPLAFKALMGVRRVGWYG